MYISPCFLKLKAANKATGCKHAKETENATMLEKNNAQPDLPRQFTLHQVSSEIKSVAADMRQLHVSCLLCPWAENLLSVQKGQGFSQGCLQLKDLRWQVLGKTVLCQRPRRIMASHQQTILS